MKKTKDSAATRTKLLDAARDVIRAKGYSATTVDDICAHAQMSKGSFFHHFASKEQLAIAAAEQFGAMATSLFAAAAYSSLPDPRDRLLAYVDFRASLLEGEVAQVTCLLGTMVQEVYITHPQIRAACSTALSNHVTELELDIEAAKQLYVPNAAWTAHSVGHFIVAVLQGSFILVKAQQDVKAARESLHHLRSYLSSLFTPAGGPSRLQH